MISEKETNIIFFSELLKTDSRFSDTCNQITKILDLREVKYEFLPNTKDIWARDYMPIQVSEKMFVEYRYDPDYLQGTRKGFRDLKTYPDIICNSINLKTIKSDIILDGGNCIKSKDCVILTDKIVKENRLLYSKEELTKRLNDIFEIDKIVLIPWDIKERFGHSDGVLRFIDDKTVLISEIYKSDKILQSRLKENGLNWEFLSFKVKKPDLKRNWAYINFLQTKDLILLPKLNIEEDEQAFEQIISYYPDYENLNRIIQVDINSIVQYGGALNCVSWTIKS